MKRYRIELSLVLSAVVALAVAWRRLAASAPAIALMTPVPVVSAAPEDSTRSDSLQVAVDAAVERDPFRLSRTPAAAHAEVAVAIAQRGVPQPAPSRHPVLLLKAIVGGPPWQAIIAGLPGQAGETVVAVGAHFESLTIRSISRDSVVVQAPDTTWKLTLRRNP